MGTLIDTLGVADDRAFAIWAAMLDVKVAYAMGVGIFARECNRGGPVRAEGTSLELAKEAEFKDLCEEHQILSAWAARKFVLFARDPANVDWVDASIREFGHSELDECPAEIHTDDWDEPDAGFDRNKENGSEGGGPDQSQPPASDARAERKRRRSAGIRAPRPQTDSLRTGSKQVCVLSLHPYHCLLGSR